MILQGSEGCLLMPRRGFGWKEKRLLQVTLDPCSGWEST